MDKTIRQFKSFEEMEAANVRDWRNVSAQDKLKAVMEITQELYALKGKVRDVPRLQRTLVRIQRPPG